MQDAHCGSDNAFIDVDDGLIRATDVGERGSKVVWHSKYSQPLPDQIYYFITRKQNPIKTKQTISHDHIIGFHKTNYGLLGYGGFSKLSNKNGGYVVKFYKENDVWKSERVISTKEVIINLKESKTGVRLLLDSQIWIHYSFIDKKFIKDNMFIKI